MKGGWWSEKSK